MGNLDVVTHCCLNPSKTILAPELTTSKSRSSKMNKIATESEEQHRNALSQREKEEKPTPFSNFPSTANKTNGMNNNQLVNHSKIDEADERFDINPRLQLISKVLSKAPLLHLEVINSRTMPKGLTLKINPFGLDNSYRKIKDGFVYFGFQENIGESPTVDYLINPVEPDYDNRFIGQHFKIEFKPESLSYSIKDMGFGFGTFIKVTDSVMIKDNSLINVGDTYIVFTFGQEEDPFHIENASDEFLNVKIFSGKDTYEPYNFQRTKSIISIGRDSECDIAIEDKMLSRVQSVITYQEGKGWFIADGKYDRKSTNGTWIFSNEEKTITNGMIFKTNHNLFECKVIQIIDYCGSDDKDAEKNKAKLFDNGGIATND